MAKSRPVKVYLLPFFAPGHQIPIVHLARLVASRGHHVTIITTPSNAQLLDKTIHERHHIRVHALQFPSDEVGLPAGVENITAAADRITASKIHRAAHLIQPQVESFMQKSPPDVFVPDTMFTWSRASAKRLGIPRVVFSPLFIFHVCTMEAIRAHPEAFESDTGPPYNIPGLPHPITFPVKPSPGFSRLMESIVDAEKDSLGVVVNSFKDFEVEYTDHYEKLTGRKVWYFGPSSLMVQTAVLPSAVGDEHECLKWLSTKKNGSVVYVCFGSLCRLSDEQLFEIALALEGSGYQFLWVVRRKNDGGEEGAEGKWLPDGFEERMKKEERGMVVKGWAPQPLILNHAAVGGFVTHCGSSSVTEAASAGVPVITMPAFGDQFLNEKLITEVHGYGVEVGVAEWSLSPFDFTKKVVSAETIEKAVKKLMDGGDEAERIKSKAKEMKERAWKAVQEGGSSHDSLMAFIGQLEGLVEPSTINATAS